MIKSELIKEQVFNFLSLAFGKFIQKTGASGRVIQRCKNKLLLFYRIDFLGF